MIDWDRVSELQEEVGENDFQDVVDMFLDEVSGEVENIAEKQTAEELEAKLHFLRGAALNLGLKRFADVCGAGETLARNGDLTSIDHEAIVSCYQASLSEFSSVITPSAAA